ncbi:hypothetical protein KAT55_09900 [Candidatus Bathyarchaeota archaeon]|nr:hypothetical protein [Candidatus Bathyarchaeota archaeon]
MDHTEMSFTDLAQDQAVKNWMGDLGEKTRGPYLWHFEKFIKWVRVEGGKFAEMSPRDMVRKLLGKELKWRLVPIRIEPATYDRFAQIAPDGDVAELLKQTVEKLLSDINQ